MYTVLIYENNGATPTPMSMRVDLDMAKAAAKRLRRAWAKINTLYPGTRRFEVARVDGERFTIVKWRAGFRA